VDNDGVGAGRRRIAQMGDAGVQEKSKEGTQASFCR
jgi:hypothetical protein